MNTFRGTLFIQFLVVHYSWNERKIRVVEIQNKFNEMWCLSDWKNENRNCELKIIQNDFMMSFNYNGGRVEPIPFSFSLTMNIFHVTFFMRTKVETSNAQFAMEWPFARVIWSHVMLQVTVLKTFEFAQIAFVSSTTAIFCNKIQSKVLFSRNRKENFYS